MPQSTAPTALGIRDHGAMRISLFAYGTLQLPQVQRATFGRLLDGTADVLVGYALAPLAISDAEVVRLSGAAVHQIARRTGDPGDRIGGLVLAITAAELAAADGYEVDVYARAAVTLASGARAFAYVGEPMPRPTEPP